MDSDIKAKQMYLKSQIMDQGYDTQQFVSYLQSQKPDGDDINNWEIQELRFAVKMFKKKVGQTCPQEEVEEVQQVEQQPVQEHIPVQEQETHIPQIPEPEYQEQPLDTFSQQKENNVPEYNEPQQSQNFEQQEYAQQNQFQEEEVKQNELQEVNNENPEDQEQSIEEQRQSQEEKEKAEEQNNENEQQKEKDDENSYQRIIKCKQTKETELYECNDVCIILNSYEKKSGGIFSSSYIAYKIQTYPFKWEVQRRYSDFLALRNILMKLYPALIIPPVSRKTNTRSYQPMFINKRMNFLEKSLNKIIKNPELKASKFVQGFLNMEDKDFKQLLKEGDKIQQSNKIENLQSVTGKIELSLNEEIDNFCHKAQDYYSNTDPIYKKIRQQSKQLIMDFDQLSATLFNLGDSFSQLYNQSQQFNIGLTNPAYQNPYLDDTYVTLNNMCIQWGNVMTTQLKVIQENICNFFKYYNSEGRQVRDHLKLRDDINKKYQDHKQKLDLKKEKLFNIGNVSTWEIPPSIQSKYSVEKLKENKHLAFQYMLPKETIHENEMREKTAFYSKQLFHEVQRLINEKVQEYSEHFNKFGHLQTDNIQEMHVLWADAMTSLETQGQHGKKLQMIQKTNTRQKLDEEEDSQQYE